MLSKDQWYSLFYTPENESILAAIRKIGFGELRIVIHEKKAVKMFPSPELRFDQKSNNERVRKSGKID